MKFCMILLLIIIWLLLIYLFSNQNGSISTKITNDVLEKYLGFINSDLTFILLRKLAHFMEYLVLGILIYNLLKEFNLSNINLISILLCFMFACFDEIHQLFISRRTGNILDVVIDGIGALSGILIINKFHLKSLSKR